MIVLRRFLFVVNVILNLILINVSKVMAKSAKEKKCFSYFSVFFLQYPWLVIREPKPGRIRPRKRGGPFKGKTATSQHGHRPGR